MPDQTASADGDLQVFWTGVFVDKDKARTIIRPISVVRRWPTPPADNLTGSTEGFAVDSVVKMEEGVVEPSEPKVEVSDVNKSAGHISVVEGTVGRLQETKGPLSESKNCAGHRRVESEMIDVVAKLLEPKTEFVESKNIIDYPRVDNKEVDVVASPSKPRLERENIIGHRRVDRRVIWSEDMTEAGHNTTSAMVARRCYGAIFVGHTVMDRSSTAGRRLNSAMWVDGWR